MVEQRFVPTKTAFEPRQLTGAALPTGVGDLSDPPKCLYLTGTLPPGPRVAVVGTRRPTVEAYRFAQELATELAQAGVVVVSGGALGIDSAAHEGALMAGAGTLVVAPASYSCPYPEENRELFKRVVSLGGGYLTPFDEPTAARRHAFFQRNALLVSLCEATVMVQAPFRSGARNALLWARRLGRPYWVVPHAPWCPQGSSSIAELRLGGRPLGSAKDVLTWLEQHNRRGVPPAAVGSPPNDDEPTLRRAPRGWTGSSPSGTHPTIDEQTRVSEHRATEATQRRAGRNAGPHRDVCKLVAQLANGPKHPDELCAVLAWEPGHLNSTVLHATLLGEVVRTASGHLATPALEK